MKLFWLRWLGVCDRLAFLGPLLIRIYMGSLFLESALVKASQPQEAVAQFQAWDIPFPHLFMYLTLPLEFLGGLFLPIGLATRALAFSLMVLMLAATLLVRDSEIGALGDVLYLPEPLFALLMFVLVLWGPGKLSLDAWIRYRFGR